MLKHKISLTYGDPSTDGHGMSETDYYMSSHTTSQIKSAIQKAEKVNKFSFEDEVCSDYENCTLSDDQFTLFSSIGVPIENYVEDDPDWRYVHDFTGLYLAIAKTQLPDLECEYIKDDSDSIDIGGYGMLSPG